MQNKMFDFVMVDLEKEIRRVYGNNPAFNYTGSFFHGYMRSFLTTLIKELPDPQRDVMIDKIVDRIIYLRTRTPEGIQEKVAA